MGLKPTRAREGDAWRMGEAYTGPPKIAWEAELEKKNFWVRPIGSEKGRIRMYTKEPRAMGLEYIKKEPWEGI